MKITFQNQTVTDTENRTESIQTEKNTWGRDKIQRNKKSVNANTFGAVYESGQIPMPVGNEENNKGKSLIELQQDAGNTNVALQQDYMTLLSHTMSQEDYARLVRTDLTPENWIRIPQLPSWTGSKQNWCVPDRTLPDTRTT